MWETSVQEFIPCNIREFTLEINVMTTVKMGKPSTKRNSFPKMSESIPETSLMNAMDSLHCKNIFSSNIMESAIN